MDESGQDSDAPTTGRNPRWSRDELILALDLYLRTPSALPQKGGPEVVELSETLNRLHRLSHPETPAKFRNPAGCYMKLQNFRRFDPSYTGQGKVGLTRGNRDEGPVWDEFAHDPARLAQVTAAIRSAVASGDPAFIATAAEDEEEGQTEAEEGRLLTRLHRYRERDRKIVQDRKALAMKRDGFLRCEACGFDFQARYGERGLGFMECHHTRPVHTLAEGSKTRLQDLALLCGNCHRMVHARRPWLTVEELRSIIRG